MTEQDIIIALSDLLKGMQNIKSGVKKITVIDFDLLNQTIELIKQKSAEADRYKGVIRILEQNVARAEAQAVKRFVKYLVVKSEKGKVDIDDILDYNADLLKEKSGSNDRKID